MDVWKIVVEKPARSKELSGPTTVYPPENRFVFTSISNFLAWYSAAIDAHFIAENKVVGFVRDMDEMIFCHSCYGDSSVCGCVQVHAGSLDGDEPEEVEFKRSPPEVQGPTITDMPEDEGLNDAFDHIFGNRMNENWQFWFLIFLSHSKSLTKYFLYMLFPWYIFGGLVGGTGLGLIYGFLAIWRAYYYYNYWCSLALSLIYGCYWYLPHRVRIWLMRKAGERMMRRIYGLNQVRIAQAIHCATAALGLYTGYKVYKQFARPQVSSALSNGEGEVQQRVVVEKSHYAESDHGSSEVQGPAISIMTEPVPQVEDPYYNDVEHSVSTDFGRRVCSWKPMAQEDVIQKLSENVVFIASGTKYGVGFVVGCNIVVTNCHLFPDHRIFKFKFKSENSFSSVNEMTLGENDVQAYPEEDLLFLRVRAMPPRKSLLDLFPRSHLKDINCKVSILGRNQDGDLVLRDGRSCAWEGLVTITYNGVTMRTMQYGTNICNTMRGECGSIYIAWTPAGPSLIGIHQNLSPTGRSRCIAMTGPEVERRCAVFGAMVQGGSLFRAEMTFSIASLSANSNLRRIEHKPPHVFGSSTARFPSKSKVCKTLIYDSCRERGFEDTYAAPVMRHRQVWINQMEPMFERTNKVDLDLMDAATEMYIDEVVDTLTPSDLSVVRVLDDFEAVNGVDGMLYVDKIPRKTSAGFPYNKPKTAFLVVDELEKAHVSEMILTDAREIELTYKESCRAMPIFMGSLKDEVISKIKAEAKSTRVFTGSPFAFSIVMRKYLLTMNALIQSKRSHFESYPGTDALGPDWEDLYHELTKFGTSRMCAGDYKKFDKSMSPMIILAAFRVLIAIAKKAGWSQVNVNVLESMKYDIAFPVVNLDGDIVMTEGGNPSGHSLTVIINCLVNCIYVRMCFIRLHPDRKFKEWVALATYGDDNVMGIREGCLLSHTTLSDFLETQGITYTMADKSSTSIPYVGVSEVTFLKRSFVFDETLQHIVGPLDQKSSQRSLMYTIPSLAVSSEAQIVDTLDTFLRESFFHGKVFYADQRRWVLTIIDQYDLRPLVTTSHFPTYSSLQNWFLGKFPIVQGGCLTNEGQKCSVCHNFDCNFSGPAIRCKRCKYCRDPRIRTDDRLFLGCLQCWMEHPMWCDVCHSSQITHQVYDLQNVVTHFYCTSCFIIGKERTDYFARKLSNGPYQSDLTRYVSDHVLLLDGGNRGSLDLEVPKDTTTTTPSSGTSFEF
jgi:hypothetical protein